MKAVHVTITGKVQGVSFRAACEREAQSHAVAGWVRNLDDGAVEAVFAGPDDAVQSMVDWCRTGPDAARVESVENEPLDPAQVSAEVDGFTVR